MSSRPSRGSLPPLAIRTGNPSPQTPGSHQAGIGNQTRRAVYPRAYLEDSRSNLSRTGSDQTQFPVTDRSRTKQSLTGSRHSVRSGNTLEQEQQDIPVHISPNGSVSHKGAESPQAPPQLPKSFQNSHKEKPVSTLPFAPVKRRSETAVQSWRLSEVMEEIGVSREIVRARRTLWLQRENIWEVLARFSGRRVKLYSVGAHVEGN